MDGFDHYRKTRKDLVTLYKVIKERYFSVVAPRSVFFTTEQLERMVRNPPPGGMERFSNPVDTLKNIEDIMHAYEIGGDDFTMNFKRPSVDVPIIYETIQEYIRLWIDVKINAYGYKTPSINELRALENVSRSLFGVYKYYHHRDRLKRYDGVSESSEFALVNAVMGGFMLGEPDELSFISYIDNYYERLQAVEGRTTVYIDKNNFTEPERQKSLTDMFEVPMMKHDLGNWQ